MVLICVHHLAGLLLIIVISIGSLSLMLQRNYKLLFALCLPPLALSSSNAVLITFWSSICFTTAFRPSPFPPIRKTLLMSSFAFLSFGCARGAGPPNNVAGAHAIGESNWELSLRWPRKISACLESKVPTQPMHCHTFPDADSSQRLSARPSRVTSCHEVAGGELNDWEHDCDGDWERNWILYYCTAIYRVTHRSNYPHILNT